MKKILYIALLLLVLCYGCVFGATKEDVMSALRATYIVGEDEIKAPNNLIRKADKYFDKANLTSEQYSNILNNINNLVGIAQKNGTIDVNQMSAQDKMKAFDCVAEASKSANIDLDEELAKNNISLQIETIPKSNDKATSKNDTKPIEKSETKTDESDKNTEKLPDEDIENKGEKNTSSSTIKEIDLTEFITPKEDEDKIAKTKEKMNEFDKYVKYIIIGRNNSFIYKFFNNLLDF